MVCEEGLLCKLNRAALSLASCHHGLSDIQEIGKVLALSNIGMDLNNQMIEIPLYQVDGSLSHCIQLTWQASFPHLANKGLVSLESSLLLNVELVKMIT